MPELHAPIVEWFRQNPSAPMAIISDMFLWWTNNLACQLGILRFMFSPSSVMAMSIIYLLRRYPSEQDDDAHDPIDLIHLGRIPNSPNYRRWQLQFLYSTRFVEGDPILDFMRDGILANMASWGLIFNSFGELEWVYLDHVMAEAGHDPAWAVGPLFPPQIDNPSGPTSGPSGSNIVAWLDTCGDQTVMYIYFGSQAVLSNNQTEQIAAGMEKSGGRSQISLVRERGPKGEHGGGWRSWRDPIGVR
ncbi:hypothetical protein Vadar_021060 [Vaccinium darrowii]|uniref:Uncharacterized protein n=1 Tax=Vaccinium darrowii TaxID=229202 RepID=A0ACB7YFG4_9ERIC|nr:hypothetical protein Vadar_021060 [Vaccinium darrowii]